MTFSVTSTPQLIKCPVVGPTSVVIENPAVNDAAVHVTQRFVVQGADEEVSPAQDPGYALRPDSVIILSLAQPIWVHTESVTQEISVTPFA